MDNGKLIIFQTNSQQPVKMEVKDNWPLEIEKEFKEIGITSNIIKDRSKLGTQ